MARYRTVSVRIWGDEKFRQLRGPPPNAQTCFVYLLVAKEATNIPGVIPASPGALADALRWSREGFLEAFDEVERLGMARADWDVALCWLPNALVHNPPANPNVVNAWGETWDDFVPECALKLEIWQALRAHCQERGEAFLKAFDEACRKPVVKGSGNRPPNPGGTVPGTVGGTVPGTVSSGLPESVTGSGSGSGSEKLAGADRAAHQDDPPRPPPATATSRDVGQDRGPAPPRRAGRATNPRHAKLLRALSTVFRDVTGNELRVEGKQAKAVERLCADPRSDEQLAWLWGWSVGHAPQWPATADLGAFADPGRLQEVENAAGPSLAQRLRVVCCVRGCEATGETVSPDGGGQPGKPLCYPHRGEWWSQYEQEYPRGAPDYGAAHFAAWLQAREQEAA